MAFGCTTFFASRFLPKKNTYRRALHRSPRQTGLQYRRMTTFRPQFQVISDLHLETPLASPSYGYFALPSRFPLLASNLLLLGDIGLIRQPQLFTFLRSLLSRTPNLKIYYVLGNHEAYAISMDGAHTTMCTFEEETQKEFGQRFHFMNQRRFDISPTITILGCTLWSRITKEQGPACARALTDFHETSGIRDRTVEDHNADHERDLAWLNEQISSLSTTEPHRQIIVLTHHSPTTDPRANDPAHTSSALNSGFRTDLSQEVCWTSGNVKLWAFGHTHYNCEFVDVENGRNKLIISRQKAYAYPDSMGNWEAQPLVVEAGEPEEPWRVVNGSNTTNREERTSRTQKPKVSVRGELGGPPTKEGSMTGIRKVLKRIKEDLQSKRP